jgi:hypothetical protein
MELVLAGRQHHGGHPVELALLTGTQAVGSLAQRPQVPLPAVTIGGGDLVDAGAPGAGPPAVAAPAVAPGVTTRASIAAVVTATERIRLVYPLPSMSRMGKVPPTVRCPAWRHAGRWAARQLDGWGEAAGLR